MIFSLEVLKAKHGDCLILHYGAKDNPKIMVIDGGPGGVYENFLRPRLDSIKATLSKNKPLPISLVMVSHMDEDHVLGILKLAEDIVSDLEDQEEPKFDIENFWFNSFDDIIGNIEIPALASIQDSVNAANLSNIIPLLGQFDEHKTAVIASTGQGRRLKKNASKMSSTINNNTDLILYDENSDIVDWTAEISIQILHPNKNRLMEMQEKWDKDLKKAKRKGDDSIIYASLAGDKDTSPFNLASIVCLIKQDGKTILLTGDSRDDDIIQGLRENNLLDSNGKIHVDILKIPHHGSDRNVSRSFFETITANHYVFSGDGKHHNPEKATLVMLEEATKDILDDFTIYFTYRKGEYKLEEKLEEFNEGKNQRGRNFKVEFINSSKGSVLINLMDIVEY